MPIDMTGTRVRLRALETRDIEPIIASYQDFDLALITDGDAPPMSDVQVRVLWTEIIESPGDDLRYFAIEPLPGNPGAGGIVGGCSLQHIDMRNRHAELAIFMTSPEWRGQGYGTEAVQLLLRYGFDVMVLGKIYLGVYTFNESAIRVYERAGFKYEGRLRDMLFYNNYYHDEWQMGMLRGEWAVHHHPPMDGLRGFHPDDTDAAIKLIQRIRNLYDEEDARKFFNLWRRSVERKLVSFQVDGTLVGLISLFSSEVHRDRIDMIVEPEHEAALQAEIKLRIPVL